MEQTTQALAQASPYNAGRKERSMISSHVTRHDGEPVYQRILTVAELAAQLQHLVDCGQGELPVFASDTRARYPFATLVPYTISGYADCFLIQPQPHLHAELKDIGRWPASYFEHANLEADQVRAACGAFA